MIIRKETKKTKYLHIRITDKMLKDLKAKNISVSATIRKFLEGILKK